MANKYLTKLFIVLGCTLFCFEGLKAQEAENETAVTNMVKEKDFTFTAVNFSTTSLGANQLTDYYSIKVTKDSIIGSLPYFGTSYTPQINLTNDGIKFTSTKYDYKLVEKKNGKYLITIRTKDDGISLQSMFFTIFSNGKAQLDITIRNRESMTFYGYISQ